MPRTPDQPIDPNAEGQPADPVAEAADPVNVDQPPGSPDGDAIHDAMLAESDTTSPEEADGEEASER